MKGWLFEVKGRFFDHENDKSVTATAELIADRVEQWKRWQSYARALPRVFRIVQDYADTFYGTQYRLEERVSKRWRTVERQQFAFYRAVG